MPVPERVPIAREAGYRTDTIGWCRDRQFLAAVTGAHRDGDRPDRRRERVRWYAYLHLFDSDGGHLRSEISLIGVAPYLSGGLREKADERLAAMVGQLAEARFGDIAVRPFTVVHDGVTFGLINESGAARGSWAELHPDRLGFSEPWDGTYST